MREVAGAGGGGEGASPPCQQQRPRTASRASRSCVRSSRCISVVQLSSLSPSPALPPSPSRGSRSFARCSGSSHSLSPWSSPWAEAVLGGGGGTEPALSDSWCRDFTRLAAGPPPPSLLPPAIPTASSASVRLSEFFTALHRLWPGCDDVCGGGSMRGGGGGGGASAAALPPGCGEASSAATEAALAALLSPLPSAWGTGWSSGGGGGGDPDAVSAWAEDSARRPPAAVAETPAPLRSAAHDILPAEAAVEGRTKQVWMVLADPPAAIGRLPLVSL
eukprot:COSAG01_NODE_14191_length_1485_cov_0.840548_1_plen_276_part_00